MASILDLQTDDGDDLTVERDGQTVLLTALDGGGNLKDISLTPEEARRVARALDEAAGREEPL